MSNAAKCLCSIWIKVRGNRHVRYRDLQRVGRLRGPIETLNPAGVAKALEIQAFGGFWSLSKPPSMIPRHHGVILFTGVIKGYPRSAPLAQGMALALAPRVSMPLFS